MTGGLPERPSERLYIAAKAPRPGLAKTRLGRAVGEENAMALYRAFLSDLAARFGGSRFALGWYVTPHDAWQEIAPLVGQEPGSSEDDVYVQVGEDWTERQRRLFVEAAARGEGRIVLVASDSPQLTVGVVEEAFDGLDHNDLVFGPTDDGGYYLIGMRAATVPHDIIGGVPMSTETVLEDLTRRAERAGLSVGRVETTFDVDEAEDLEHLRRIAPARPDLAATRAALEQLETGAHPDEGGKPGPEGRAKKDG